MWTVEYASCGGCGAELALETDGREARVDTSQVWESRIHSSDIPGSTTTVWRDGLLLVARCPVTEIPANMECLSRVVWYGEGRSLETEPFAAPILDEEPTR